MKVQAHSFLEATQSGPDAFDKFDILGVTEILCSFRLFLERKTGKEIPESSRLEFLEILTKILLYQMQKSR